MKPLKIYVAGKVSKDSVFGTHHWRDKFCNNIEELSGRKLINLDPLKTGKQHNSPEDIFRADVALINECDVVIVYLSDDISVGGSQEILIAKYFRKLVIGLAPKGGKFNGASKEMLGKIVENYKDPFVFTTCDVVVEDIEQVADVIRKVENLRPQSLSDLLDD